MQSYLSVCLWIHLWVFINWRWQYTYTVRQVYIRQVVFQCFLFWLRLEMPPVKPTCRRGVQECLSLFSSPTNSKFWLYLRRTLGCACTSLLSLQKDHWWMQNIYPKASFSYISWNQAMLWSIILLEYWPIPSLSLLHLERLSWKAQFQQNLQIFFFPKFSLFPVQQNPQLEN